MTRNTKSAPLALIREFIYIKLGFCWNCHWKLEQVYQIDFINRPLVNEIAKSAPFSYSLNDSQSAWRKIEKHKQYIPEQTNPYQLMTKAVDVFGKESEPICDYRQCHHKISVHGRSGKCRCKHPQNATIGA